MPRVDLGQLMLGHYYSRPELARLWGYKSHKAIESGVVTPKGTALILVFVTRIKQGNLPQYRDYLSGDLLAWEGQKKHRTDQAIINAEVLGKEIHLFYREIHHAPFEYRGPIRLRNHSLLRERPSRYEFQLVHDLGALDDIERARSTLIGLNETERQVVVRARLGQGPFRAELITKWDGCAVTGIKSHTLLRASHIKPWRDCSNPERVDTYNGFLLAAPIDHLFDKGLVTFRNSGKMVVSELLTTTEKSVFGLDGQLMLRFLEQGHLRYLEYHRDVIYQRRSE